VFEAEGLALSPRFATPMLMSEEEKRDQSELAALEGSEPEPEEEEDEYVPTPFDNPWVLPCLLLAFVLWFGYDGWINQDPDMLEHLTFNRWGTLVLSVLAAYFGWQAYRATPEVAEGDDPKAPEPKSS
jgi:hypothetical protein